MLVTSAGKRKPPAGKLREETVRRRAAQAQRQRDQVLTIAADLFGERGYHDTSMREIARQAGFSIGALYERFPSKDALYYEVVRQLFEQVWAALEQARSAHSEFLPRLTAVAETMFGYFTANRTFLRIYGLQPANIAAPYRSKITQLREEERGVKVLTEVFTQGQQDGAIGATDDAELLASMFMGIIVRLGTDYLSDRRPLPSPDRVAAIFVGGLAPGH
jgi:TetR/AcrR family transcriptional regulator